MVGSFPLSDYRELYSSIPIHVGSNTVVYKCPYSQEYVPQDSVAISIGTEDHELCFYPKYFNEFLDQIGDSYKDEQIMPNVYGVSESSPTCGCCFSKGIGLVINMEYYFSCDLNQRSSELPMEYEYSSHKESRAIFLCSDCIQSIKSYFPSEEVKSVVASQTL